MEWADALPFMIVIFKMYVLEIFQTSLSINNMRFKTQRGFFDIRQQDHRVMMSTYLVLITGVEELLGTLELSALCLFRFKPTAPGDTFYLILSPRIIVDTQLTSLWYRNS